jgi:hypothetical protein
MEKISQKNVLQLWANQYPEIERWLSHLQQQRMNAFYLYRFCEWCHFTPPQLLDLKAKDPTANIVEKMLDDFCNVKDERFVNSFKYKASIAVKSFFRWNYRDLAKACGYVNLQKVKPYNALNKEGLRKLWSHARNLRDRALIPFVLSTAIAKETLSKLQWKDLEENWENIELPCLNVPPEKLKGHGRGKYANLRQITFLTNEAKRALIDYKDWMERKHSRMLTPEDHIWLDITPKAYKPLAYDSFTTIVLRLSKDSGVPFSWHDARRWVNTALEQIAISSNWARKIRGRKVKGEEAPYSQPAINQLRAKFREAVPLLEFTTETSGLEERIARQEFLTELNRKDVAGETLTIKDEENIKRFNVHRAFMRRVASIPDEKCVDGEHCGEEFKDIAEEALLGYLKKGWALIHTLKNGHVIVKRK